MKAGFWLVTFPPAADVGNCQVLQTALSMAREPPLQGIPSVAIEIIQFEPSFWSVLVSAADSADLPRRLHCVSGFSNHPGWCNEAARFGLPVIDADIELVGTTLTITADAYAPRADGKESSPKPIELMRISNLTTAAGSLTTATSGVQQVSSLDDLVYRQLVATPDLARPDTLLIGRSVDSRPSRSSVERAKYPEIRVSFEDKVLYPDLFRLAPEKTVAAQTVWTGESEDWYARPMGPPERFNRSSVFGSPSFVFEGIEIVGFRTEVQDRAALSELVKQLNFHREKSGAGTVDDKGPIDFRYRAATATVVIELLRYGKMRARDPQPPFEADDFMSQHELLVRILVGRVDDDTSQAREAAIFVPAIFVDNPWSKAVGRCLQGFPKLLVEVVAGTVPVDMNGCAKTGAREPLPFHGVTQVRLIDRTGANSQSAPLLTLDCPDAVDGSAGQFFPPPSLPLLSTALLRRAPFEQFDFDDPEFRRGFAKEVLTDGFCRFRSVQVSPVSPVDEIRSLPKAWIMGSGELRNVEVAFPTGVATLKLEVPPSEPKSWTLLVNALGESQLPGAMSGGQTLAFPTGDWYRVRCSMELTVDDALE